MARIYTKAAAKAAAKLLAGQEAGLLVYGASGEKKLEHKFKFKDSSDIRNDCVRMGVEESGNVIGQSMPLQYDVAIELARIGLVDMALADGGTERVFLLNY